MDALRTPRERFVGLPSFGYVPQYLEVGGLRIGYLDTEARDVDGDVEPTSADADETFLCLHGTPSWSFLYRKMIPTLSDRGRVVAMDLPGFGRSDKYPEMDAYTFDLFYDAIVGFIETLELSDVTLVAQDWGGMFGLVAAANHPERFGRLVPMNTGLPNGRGETSEEAEQFREFMATVDELDVARLVQNSCLVDLDDDVLAGYAAPYPEEPYKAGLRALPGMIPTDPDDEVARRFQDAREKLHNWDRPAFVLFSDSDPVTRDGREVLRETIPTATEQPDVWIEDAGHFLQEDAGEEVAERVIAFVERT